MGSGQHMDDVSPEGLKKRLAEHREHAALVLHELDSGRGDAFSWRGLRRHLPQALAVVGVLTLVGAAYVGFKAKRLRANRRPRERLVRLGQAIRRLVTHPPI